MNTRDRFNKVLLFQKPDRHPLFEFFYFWEETIDRWCSEGLPQKPIAVHFPFGAEKALEWWREYGRSALEYFGLDEWQVFPIDSGPIPSFTPKVLVETNRYIVKRNPDGITWKQFKPAVTRTLSRSFVDFPVKTRDDWERLKDRFDPEDIRRYPKNWDDDDVEEYYEKVEWPIGLWITGFFAQPRQLMGLERFLKVMYRDPKLLRDIIDFWTDFEIELHRKLLMKIKIDFAYIWEDMAETHGPMISPKHFREFILPSYKRLTRFLKRNGVKLVGVDTDGDASVLIPLFIEGGVNLLFPLEVQSGMDAISMRDEYGKKLAFIGNIDKRIIAGDEEAIRKEVEYKLSIVDEGGYIPSFDHIVPSNVSFDNYSYYIDLIKRHLNQTE